MDIILATLVGLIIVISICLLPAFILLAVFDKLTIDMDMEEDDNNNLNNKENGNY